MLFKHHPVSTFTKPDLEKHLEGRHKLKMRFYAWNKSQRFQQLPQVPAWHCAGVKSHLLTNVAADHCLGLSGCFH
jgi:hypothetical protein